MTSKSANFPLYRKYANNRSFFEIQNEEEFTELQLIAQHYSLTHIKASILPDRNYIMDLISNSFGNYVEIDANEYNTMLNDCKQNRTLLL